MQVSLDGALQRRQRDTAGGEEREAWIFPDLEARSLTGHRYLLPAGFEGDFNAVLVGFEIWHQALMDSWLPALDALAARRSDLRIYELVPIPRASLPARPFIDGGMARGIPSEAVRARTLTAFTDLKRLLPALGLTDTRDSALYLVEHGGRVRWWTRGGFDPERTRDLARALANGAERSPGSRRQGEEGPGR